MSDISTANSAEPAQSTRRAITSKSEPDKIFMKNDKIPAKSRKCEAIQRKNVTRWSFIQIQQIF